MLFLVLVKKTKEHLHFFLTEWDTSNCADKQIFFVNEEMCGLLTSEHGESTNSARPVGSFFITGRSSARIILIVCMICVNQDHCQIAGTGVPFTFKT